MKFEVDFTDEEIETILKIWEPVIGDYPYPSHPIFGVRGKVHSAVKEQKDQK